MWHRIYFTACIAVFLCNVGIGKKTCEQDELPCDSDDECIDRQNWCDDYEDCKDGSDEAYCEKKAWLGTKDPNSCKETHFLCKSGVCVPKVAFCDTHKDCDDGSDEDGCDEESTSDSLDSPTVSPLAVDVSPSVDEDGINNDVENGLVQVSVRPQVRMDLARPELAVSRGLQWLISVRQPNYGWGTDTARALITLGLTELNYFLQHEDADVMKKQLEVVIAVDMLRNRTQPVSLSRLSLYINALLATCQDPSNFYGMNLVAELRQRVSAAYSVRHHRNSPFVNPIAHLTLCFVNQSIVNDVHKLMDTLRKQSNEIRWHDMKSISIMALHCIVENNKFAQTYSSMLEQAVAQLHSRISPDGSFSNIYSTALAVQALIFVNARSLVNWNQTLSLSYLADRQQSDGSFGDLLATYYILPSLAGRSLIRLSSMPCSAPSIYVPNGLTPLELLLDSQGPRHYVRYSLLYGYPVEVSYSILLHVPVGTNFFDIMRLAAYTDPKFKFLYENKDGEFSVYSIGNIPNDAERGVYWHLYAELGGRHTPTRNGQPEVGSNLRLFATGAKKLIPKDRDHIAYWYRPI